MRQYPNARRPYGLSLRTFFCLCMALLCFFCALPTPIHAAPQSVYLGGMPFGVTLHTKGVLVTGVSEVEGEQGKANPAYEAGIRIKDVITHVNSNEVHTVRAVRTALEESAGKSVELTVLRQEKTHTFHVKPVKGKDGLFRCGLWIRDHTAGIGTVTFIIPTVNTFAGLGHGICDGDTGALMPLLRGYVYDVTLDGIVKGSAGHPGELKGHFHSEQRGTLQGNTPQGVFGVLTEAPTNATLVPIATAKEVTEGPAQLYCTLGDTVNAYTVQISRINRNSDLKNFVIEVTDPKLLEQTGGIVQGMSGSPLMQNGKLIGAVTHVFINDSGKGYGILIENMLAQIPSLLAG